MKEQLEQVLKSAGYRVVAPEALAPNLVSIIGVGMRYEPLAFTKVRKIYTFWIWMRVYTPDQAEEKAEALMDTIWQAFNEVGELRADFQADFVQVTMELVKEE